MTTRAFFRLIGCLVLSVLLIGTFLAVQASSPQQLTDPSEASDRIQHFLFLSGVSRDFAACDVTPNLYSPSDGSRLTTTTPTFHFNGGIRPVANPTWLQFDLSQDPDFAAMVGHYPSYFQPAQKDWQITIGPADALEPGTYYWRASLWCNGPGWPPPPNPGEIRGPYSEVFSFTIQP
jgi:hypothetical protein